jgi:hypothetical protein
MQQRDEIDGVLRHRHERQVGAHHDHAARGVVVRYCDPESDYPSGHESATRGELAKKLAALKGYDFAGEYDAAADYGGSVYFVPSHTLVGIDTARRLGIRTEDDLFGGVVPYSFVATKTITHPLVHPGAFAPTGWSHHLGARLQDVVLFGFSAFTKADARRAGALVLERGPARVKPACAVGGRGQTVVTGRTQLDAVLHTIDTEELSRDGIVIEQNFDEITTCSVGQLRVAELRACYYGTQRVTLDNRGREVYGGSELVVVRGEYGALLALDLTTEIRQVIAQAQAYDAAAADEFPGLLASRRNYDVACVTERDGRRRSGVLEQSWRVGGASPAEIAALEAFRADPGAAVVRSSCIELYGSNEPPPEAVVHFRGVDQRVGPVTKYTMVEAYGNAR